ncbi:MAG: undecaprenyl-diphosphate phosphatase [Candidatus Omnitrophota bacterium]
MRYFFLALFQGITEFIPVSSSGHLVLLQKMFGFQAPMIAFDVILHLATTLSVIIFLRKELGLIIKEFSQVVGLLISGEKWLQIGKELPYARVFVLLMAALLPAIFIGVALDKVIEKMFVSLTAVGISLFVTGTVLFFTKFVNTERQIKNITLKDALFIGLAQAAAIIPGLSRSGMTIAAGMFRGIDKNAAARFSFMLSVPTILAAAVYKLRNGLGELSIPLMQVIVSFIIAFISGYAALVVLSRMIAKAKFHYFSYYCWLIGIASIVIAIFT